MELRRFKRPSLRAQLALESTYPSPPDGGHAAGYLLLHVILGETYGAGNIHSRRALACAQWHALGCLSREAARALQ